MPLYSRYLNVLDYSIFVLRKGMTPGLWIAPFSCDKHSQIAKTHPDWILRSANGVPINSANCGNYILQIIIRCEHLIIVTSLTS